MNYHVQREHPGWNHPDSIACQLCAGSVCQSELHKGKQGVKTNLLLLKVTFPLSIPVSCLYTT